MLFHLSYTDSTVHDDKAELGADLAEVTQRPAHYTYLRHKPSRGNKGLMYMYCLASND